MSLKNLLILLITIASGKIYTQAASDIPGNYPGHGHRNEISIASAAAFNGDALSYSMHVHYIYNISESNFGIGLGFERIFFKFRHNTVGLVLSYRPLEKLILISSPGVTFENDNLSSPIFTLHTEMAYEFEIGDIHLGPALDFAFDSNDYHIGSGIHVGYGF